MRKNRVLIVIICLIAYLAGGAVVPFVIQPEITKETEIKWSAETGQAEAGQPDGTQAEMGQTEETVQKTGISTERACVLADNTRALEERVRLIAEAENRIILSTFDFRADESGKDVLCALYDAAQRGVRVEILVDGVSGLIWMNGSKYFKALAGEENVQIRIYNPVNPIKPWRLMGRLHDKYLIADDKAYILGGRNTFDFFMGDYGGYQNYDWDVLVWDGGNDIESGTSVKQLTKYFESIWEQPLCRDYRTGRNSKSVQKAQRELEDRYKELQRNRPDWFGPYDYRENTREVRGIELVSNPTHFYAKEPVVFYRITELMSQAKEEVRFHTPYIVCNRWMTKRLREICDRVPRVTMMTNSAANNANLFGAMDYQRKKKEILDTGLQILEYDSGVSYHGKCFVIDDNLSGIGSFNWDMRSTYIDTEVMAVIDSEEINADLRKEMSRYERTALVVAEDGNVVQQGEMQPQKVGFWKQVQLILLRITAGWARFLM